MRYVTLAVACASFAICTAAVDAQQPASSSIPSVSGIHAGDRIRLTTTAFSTTDGSSFRCEGSVAHVIGDTLVLHDVSHPRRFRPDDLCPTSNLAPGEINAMWVLSRNRGSRLKHTALGLLGGAGIGLLAGTVAAENCRNCGDDAGILAVLVAEGSVLLGGAIGLALPAGLRWKRVSSVPDLQIR